MVFPVSRAFLPNCRWCDLNRYAHEKEELSSREEEFHARFERFKARMRELRGLRVNQFMGLLDHTQQRKVLLIVKEVEEFVRKFAYGGGLSPLIQENILTAFNSDQVMRRRIELQSGESGSAGVAAIQAREARKATILGKALPEKPAPAAPAGGNGNGNGGDGAQDTGTLFRRS